MSKKITASIVLYKNTTSQIENLLDSLKYTRSLKVYIIDNSPSDALKTTCEQHHNTQYFHTPENPGFGASHNYAIKMANDSEIHFIINPDIYFENETIITLSTYLEKNKDVCCAVPKVIYPDGKLQRLCKLLPSPLNLFARRFLPRFAKRLDHNYEMMWFNYDKTVEIPCASGCFMAVRTDSFRKSNGFDEQFFMYMEDIDLSRRLARAGKIIYNPDALVIHEFAKSSYKSKKLLLAHIKSAIQYFNKWGWFFDKERAQINKDAIARIKKSSN